jgi:hypothetical protein
VHSVSRLCDSGLESRAILEIATRRVVRSTAHETDSQGVDEEHHPARYHIQFNQAEVPEKPTMGVLAHFLLGGMLE